MAKQTKPDFQKYQYGALAGRFLASKESGRYAPGALEVLAGAKGLDLGEEALGFIRGTQASEKGIQTAAGIYTGKFEEKRGEYTPAELANWYGPVLAYANLEKKDQDKILATLNEHDETLNAIREASEKANYIVDAPDGLFTDEQKDRAKKLVEKYQKVLLVINVLDNYKFESLRSDAVTVTSATDLKGLASKL
ncbi:MAG: hypothetical protein ABSG05_00435 [Candidatus Pacearchaeota archaeon]